MTTLLKHLAALSAVLAVQAFAQTPNDLSAAEYRYKKEVADCAVTNPVVGRAECLREARNSWAEYRHGRMNETWKPSDFERNALQRCEVHSGDDRTDCIARIRGQGRTIGSVAGGGILRELTTRKVMPVTAPAMQTAPKEPEGPPPSGLMSNCRWVPPTDWICK